MDADIRTQMLAYYNERAREYEEAYTVGSGTASISDPRVFVGEAKLLADIARHFGTGHLIDVACGTGYWLPCYASRCSHITLFDQSEKMLDECRQKVDALGIADRCHLLQGDLFETRFSESTYDCALIGFLIGHLSEPQEKQLFDLLRHMLTSTGQFLILESAWSELRTKFNTKAGSQQRRLNDGTTFEIYKRYIGLDDIAKWSEEHGITTHIEYFGQGFCAISGRFDRNERVEG